MKSHARNETLHSLRGGRGAGCSTLHNPPVPFPAAPPPSLSARRNSPAVFAIAGRRGFF